MYPKNVRATLFALLSVLLFSCGTAKKITYVQDVPDSIFMQPYRAGITTYSAPVIKPNDIMQISILTLDPAANNILTPSNSSTFTIQSGTNTSGNTQPVSGFMVDEKGMIELPLAGKIKIAGLTTSMAKDTIRNRIAKLYKDPVINIRYANFNITVLGEVARPASYIVPNEKISILDAIGMAGDLTIYGKRENILLIRDSSGHKLYGRFNLNSGSIMQSPFFYLQQGDVVYVEPSKSKIVASDGTRTRGIAIIASAISLFVVILSRL